MTLSIDPFADSVSYLTIFLVVLIFPTESIMPLAGYAASRDAVSLPIAILVGTLGSTFGSLVIYGLAHIMSATTTEQLIARHGKWLGLTERRVSRAGKWFDAHARATVCLGRFMPGMRTVVSIPAGNRRMPLGSFLLFTAIGTGTWISVLAVLGYVAEDQYARIQSSAALSTSLVGVCVLVVGVVAFYRLKKR